MRKKIIAIGIFVILTIGMTYGFFGRKTYNIPISTKMSKAGIPLIEATVQNVNFFLRMDLGSRSCVTLDKKLLDQLNKKNAGTQTSRDIFGNVYETPAYVISKIEIANFFYEDVLVKQKSDEFTRNTTFGDDPKAKEPVGPIGGAIGRGLLEKRNLLLDFYNSRIFISNDLKKLKKGGYNLEEFCKCPFEIGKTGAILVFDTNMGKARLSLDTGSTLCYIRSSFVAGFATQNSKYQIPFVTSSIFKMGGKDFGSMNLYLQDITSELSELDGILGMDFLENHVVYIDYKDKVIYVGECK